jgi:hypothetical protein
LINSWLTECRVVFPQQALPASGRIDSTILIPSLSSQSRASSLCTLNHLNSKPIGTVHLHRNLNQKQHIFAFQIAPVTAVKLLDSITSSRIIKGQFLHAKPGQYWMQINRLPAISAFRLRFQLVDATPSLYM